MRYLCLLFVLYAAIPQNSFADDWTKTEKGSIRIDRFWEESFPNYNVVYVLVSYRNTTSRTFNIAVTIRATILDENKNKIDMNDRSFFAWEVGPIEPDFESEVKIPIECEKGMAKYASVAIESAN